MSAPRRLTDQQALDLGFALGGPRRATRWQSLNSLLARGYVERVGGRPGNITYAITQAGRDALTAHRQAEGRP